MGDGFALLARLLSLSDQEPDARAAGVVHDGGGERLLARAAHLARDAGGMAAGLRNMLALPFEPPTRLRGRLSGERRVAWSKRIPLEAVKALGRRHGATVNDIVLTAVAGSLRSYLLEHGDAPEQIRSLVPVNLRPASSPGLEAHGNWFGLVFLALPSDVGERRDRLEAIRAEMTRLKNSKEPLVALGILAALGRSPAMLGRLVRKMFARKASIVVTNVPGPKQPLRLAGQPIRDIWFWVPHPSGLACGISILSYAGGLRIGVRSDAGVVPDPDWLVRDLDGRARSCRGCRPRPSAVSSHCSRQAVEHAGRVNVRVRAAEAGDRGRAGRGRGRGDDRARALRSACAVRGRARRGCARRPGSGAGAAVRRSARTPPR
jgi:diacylglycerol O-acyltransferase